MAFTVTYRGADDALKGTEMKRIIFAIAILSAIGAFAQTAQGPLASAAKEQPRLTPERMKQLREGMMRRIGGIIPRPDRYPGICFLDCTNGGVPEGAIDKVIWKVKDEFYRSAYSLKGEFTTIEALGAYAAANTNHACVIAIAEAGNGLPWMLTAPDSRWALVNLTPLKADKPKTEKLFHRVEFVAQRAFGIMMGAAWTAQGVSVMMPAKDLAELDSIRGQVMPPDCHFPVIAYCDLRGVAKGGSAPYRQACVEGWAPAPTNDIQKAIWDEIKAKKK